jgi:hypothetical protein
MKKPGDVYCRRRCFPQNAHPRPSPVPPAPQQALSFGYSALLPPPLPPSRPPFPPMCPTASALPGSPAAGQRIALPPASFATSLLWGRAHSASRRPASAPAAPRSRRCRLQPSAGGSLPDGGPARGAHGPPCTPAPPARPALWHHSHIPMPAPGPQGGPRRPLPRPHDRSAALSLPAQAQLPDSAAFGADGGREDARLKVATLHMRARSVGVDRGWLGSQAFTQASAFNANIGAWNIAAVTSLSMVCAAFSSKPFLWPMP